MLATTASLPTSLRAMACSFRALCSVPAKPPGPPNAEEAPKRFLPATRKQMYEGLLGLVPDSPPDSRVLRIGLLGMPGVGKSSLVNRLALFAACATSQKVNTTRSKQNVAFTQGNTQLIFLDLPGLIRKTSRYVISRSLIRDPHAGIFQADIILVVVDVSNGYQRRALDKELLQCLHFFPEKPTVLVLTKTDTLGKKKAELLRVTRRLTTGVVNGVLSVRDLYARRFRNERTGPDPQELLERPATLALAEGHLAELPESEIDTILGQLERLKEKEEEEEEVAGGPERKEEEHAPKMELESGEKATSEQIEAFFSANPPLPGALDLPGPGELRPRLGHTDGMLLVLREQMLLQSATRAEVAARVRRWRNLESEVRGETAWTNFSEVFMVSAVTGRGIEPLRDYLLSQAKPGPWAYHSSLVSDQDPADTIRFAVYAQCLNNLAKEVPYELRIEVEEEEEDPESGDLFFDVGLLCRTERQLKILVGTGGSVIKRIADASVEDLQAAFGSRVRLRLKAKLASIPRAHLQAMKRAKDVRKVFSNTET